MASFPSDGFQCTAIISQSFMVTLTRSVKTKSYETSLLPPSEMVLSGVRDCIHLTFWAFWADSVTLLAPAAILFLPLMTSIATLCLRSPTVKWPRGGQECFQHSQPSLEPYQKRSQELRATYQGIDHPSRRVNCFHCWTTAAITGNVSISGVFDTDILWNPCCPQEDLNS